MSTSRVTHILGALMVLAAALIFGVSPTSAEELILKDGQKIVGTIVGFENGMFRVETPFGFALVRKDKVASVDFEVGSPKEATRKPDQRVDENRASSDVAGDSKSSLSSGPLEAGAGSGGSGRMPGGATPSLDKPTSETRHSRVAIRALVPAVPEFSGQPPEAPRLDLNQALQTAAAPPPNLLPGPPVSRPVDEPLPPEIEERLEGNTYINETFQFAMFKPPGWKVFEGVPKETGSGIMAVGTEDEQTVLFVDRELWSGPPDLEAEHAEARFRNTYQEFQKLSESPIELAGCPAVRRTFRGIIDGVEWHGVSVHLARGNIIFGIVGLTSAETYQFQQAIFNKIINSFRFLKPSS